ncbi:uncharacterized protein NPIL_305571 [Nephila pilipes]|uniref:Uncharacterized protein n=1 Tax=Nephila pilipes TaxID=299642 RepID=A0A8X6N9Z8_NEPPI|nr:uncharacterized protein NPIL_305571 [Nephila pilipes]
MEELPSLKSLLSEVEEFCETHFKSTYKINYQGRFVVKLPIYRDINPLGETKSLAISKLLAMENKFKLDSEFEKEFKDFMKEYEEAGHMLPNKNLNSSKQEYFLFHHALQKKKKKIALQLNFELFLMGPENLRTQVCHISNPRWFQFIEKEITLHDFSDASESAYACAIYVVQRNDNGINKVTILAAKSKVVSLKAVSIPRLKLNGAFLFARLFSALINTLKDHVINFYACTDSQVVFSWLCSPSRNWKSFIANRTTEILDRIPQNRWRYVPTKKSPADMGSRGVSLKDLADCRLWWKALVSYHHQMWTGLINQF